MKNNKITITIQPPEEGWEKYGDVMMLVDCDVSGGCGGIYTLEKAKKQIEHYISTLKKLHD